MHPYPGNEQHQALLRGIHRYYQDDDRILAVLVFGSLGRGDWDEGSDLDLDIITADGVEIDVITDATRLCASFAPIHEELALLIPYEDQEVDLVLASLAMLSIRYHPLSTTKAAILDTMQPLFSRIDLKKIHSAGMANWRDEETPLAQMLEQIVRYAVVANVYVHRESFWDAVEVFHRMRSLLIEINARSHRTGRALQSFQAQAPDILQEKLKRTLRLTEMDDLKVVLREFSQILLEDLPAFSAGQLELNDSQRTVLEKLKGMPH